MQSADVQSADLQSLDDLIAHLGGDGIGMQSAGPSRLLMEHIQAARRDLPATLDNYLKGLTLGGSRPLPELFEASGIAFDFTDKTIAPLMHNVKDALLELAS